MALGIILKALSNPIRRDIIARLRERDMTAGELADAYSVSKPTMSTHFAALKEAGLIEGRRDGVVIHYSLNATVAEEALAALMQLLGTSDERLPLTAEPGETNLKTDQKS